MSEESPTPDKFESYFVEQPPVLEQYIPGEPVTRARFTDMLITSFNRSRGDLGRQVLYLSWVEARSGFHWEPALKTFIDKDGQGWDWFTGTERDLFLNRFLAVKIHEFSAFEGEKWQSMLERPAEIVAVQLDGLYVNLHDHPGLRKDFQETYKPFAEIATEQEFGIALDRFSPVRKHRDEANYGRAIHGTEVPWHQSFIQRIIHKFVNGGDGWT